MRPGTRAVAAAVPAALALAAAGWALAGPAGLLAAAVCATVPALLLLYWRTVGPAPRRPAPGSSRTPFPNAKFARYRKVADALSWGQVSARHFDHSFRPLLERITAAVLLERRGIDTAADPPAARALLGPSLWALADPAAARSDDSTRPSPPLERVEQLIRRLEDL